MPPAVLAVAGATFAASAAYSGGIVLFSLTLMDAGLSAAIVAGIGPCIGGPRVQQLEPRK